jgi:hypothetical protein
MFNSIIIGFLTVVGIDQADEDFSEASVYTTKLSAFIRFAQLLVIQQAVVMAETNETEYPLQMLEQL